MQLQHHLWPSESLLGLCSSGVLVCAAVFWFQGRLQLVQGCKPWDAQGKLTPTDFWLPRGVNMRCLLALGCRVGPLRRAVRQNPLLNVQRDICGLLCILPSLQTLLHSNCKARPAAGLTTAAVLIAALLQFKYRQRAYSNRLSSLYALSNPAQRQMSVKRDCGRSKVPRRHLGRCATVTGHLLQGECDYWSIRSIDAHATRDISFCIIHPQHPLSGLSGRPTHYVHMIPAFTSFI